MICNYNNNINLYCFRNIDEMFYRTEEVQLLSQNKKIILCGIFALEGKLKS